MKKVENQDCPENLPTNKSKLPTNYPQQKNKTSKKYNINEESLEAGGWGGIEEDIKTPSNSKCKSANKTTYRSAALLQDPFSMSTLTGQSGIYGVPDHALLPIIKNSDNSEKQLEEEAKPRTIRNYHIKSIRKGIPLSTLASRRPTITIQSPEVVISPYCLCYNYSFTKRNPLAWIYSLLIFLLSVVCPLTSFFCDVAFFVVCTDHYNESASLLAQAQNQSWKALPSNNAISSIYAPSVQKQNDFENEIYPAPLRDSIDIRSVAEVTVSINKNDVNKAIVQSQSTFQIRHRKPDVAYSIKTSPAWMTVTYGTTQPSTWANVNSMTRNMAKIIQSTWIPECPAAMQTSVCNNVSVIREYLLSKQAGDCLEDHRRITVDVFEPVFIIGSFPCLILCIFARIVVMAAKHDDFLSAYVINMVSMPLQLATGALAVHSASYHLGLNGFECWECAVDGNCSDVDALSWMNDGVTKSLIRATAAKLIDGAAGGCVLFVVLARIIWNEPGHVSCWWHLGRLLLFIPALLFCILVSATMVITPTVGVFRLQMIQKTAYFPNRDEVCHLSMILFGMGLAAWGISLLFLFIYLTYRTFIYCRRKEHVVNSV